jgi:hypothetical protein
MFRVTILVLAMILVGVWAGRSYIIAQSLPRSRDMLAEAPRCLTSFFSIVAVEGDAKRVAVAKRVLAEARAPCARSKPVAIAFREMAAAYLFESPEALATLRDWLQRGGFVCKENAGWIWCDCEAPPILVYYWPCTECTPMFSGRDVGGPHSIRINIMDNERMKLPLRRTRFEVSASYISGPY